MIATAIFLCFVASTTFNLAFLGGFLVTAYTGPSTESGTTFANGNTIFSYGLVIKLMIDFLAFFFCKRGIVVMIMPWSMRGIS